MFLIPHLFLEFLTGCKAMLRTALLQQGVPLSLLVVWTVDPFRTNPKPELTPGASADPCVH